MKKFIVVLALLFLPAVAAAQVSSVFGRTGTITAQSGDYTCSQVTNCGPINAPNTWTGQNQWNVTYTGSTGNPTTYPIIYHSGAASLGIVSPRSATVLQLVGVPSTSVGTGEVNIVDAFAYNGYAQYSAERYDRGGPNNGRVQSGEVVGVYSFNPYDGVSDATTAAMSAVTTETQINDTNHGTALWFAYTPNGAGSNKRYTGITISRSGAGGVTIGDTGYQSPPTDQGAGTLNVAGALYANNGAVVADNVGHLRGMAGSFTPSINNSGTVVTGSTDNRGEISSGGTASTSWQINWARNWPTRPFCTVTPLSTAGGAYSVSMTVASMGVTFANAYNGGFDWVCL
jgi:hypothetical protein